MATFDRQAALDAGYTEQEIEQYLSEHPDIKAGPSPGSAESRVEEEEPREPPLSLELLPLAGGLAGIPLGPLGMGAGAVAGYGMRHQLAKGAGYDVPEDQAAAGEALLEGLLAGGLGAGGKLVMRGGRALMGAARQSPEWLRRMLIRRIPGMHTAMDVAEAVGEVRKAGGAASGAGDATREALARIRAGAGRPSLVGVRAPAAPARAVRAKPAAKKAPEGKVVGHVGPEGASRTKPARPKKGGKAKEVGTAESRTVPPKSGSRHEVQYFSESKGQYINIEDMNQKHIETAYRKLAEKNPKKGSVARRVMDALLDESKHRLQTTGIHIGQTPPRRLQ